MTRLRTIAPFSDCLVERVSCLALLLLSPLLVSCVPPPSRLGGTTIAPTFTYTKTEPAPSVTPTLFGTQNEVPTDATFPVSGELHLALRESINSLNPYLATTESESFVVSCLYDTLADEDSQGHLVPNLAQRWELSADGTRLTCWLNAQARWHTGLQVTADDVVFSFDLVRQTAFPGLAPVAALVGPAEALGPAEVQFTLLKPGAETARRICSQVPIVPAALWKHVRDPLTYANLDGPVGSGPFALLQQAEDGGLVLQNTGMHHSTQPRIDKLILQIIRDESQALEALNDGKFDLLGWDISPEMAREVQDNPQSYPEIRLATAAGLSVRSLLFNLRLAPYDNPSLRSALAQAIDTQAIVDQVRLGFAGPAQNTGSGTDLGGAGLFPPASPWYDGSLSVVPFDAKQAMEKLTSAGFVDRDGDGSRENPDGSALQIPITYAKSEASLKVVELVVAAWEAVGIKAKAAAVPADQFRSVLMQANFNVVLYDLSLREPEEAYFYFHSSRGLLVAGQVAGSNYGGYGNAEYDRIAEALLEEQNGEKRLELLRQLQRILTADLPQIPLYSPYVLQLYRDSSFSGWHLDPRVGLLSRAAIASLGLR